MLIDYASPMLSRIRNQRNASRHISEGLINRLTHPGPNIANTIWAGSPWGPFAGIWKIWQWDTQRNSELFYYVLRADNGYQLYVMLLANRLHYFFSPVACKPTWISNYSVD
jgi:hypothetical protein